MRKIFFAILVLIVGAGAARAQEVVRIIAGTASAAGVGDAFFVTDVRLYNPDPENTITVHLSFLRRDVDSSGATEFPVEIPPRRGVALNDVLSTFFGLTDVSGSIRLRSDSPFLASSRTYNVGGEAGTFGSFIPGLSPDDALQQGILLQVVNDSADTGFRANIGFTNPGLTTVTVTVKVYNADTGELIGERGHSVPPRAFSQINNIFRFVGQRTLFTVNAVVEFTADAPLLAYAAVLDNTSDDPIVTLAIEDEGTPPPPAENQAPTGTIISPSGNPSILEGENVQFVGAVSDPEGDDVTVLWDFGDGITSTQVSPGSHTYSQAGTFSVTFTATDEHGLADPTPPTRTVTVSEPPPQAATFTRVQNEIFNTSCALSGCHNAGSAQAGQNLSQGAAYNNIVNVPSTEQPSKDRIEPSDLENSYMWLKVTGDSSISGGRMPLGRPALSQDRLDLLRDWILAGALND